MPLMLQRLLHWHKHSATSMVTTHLLLRYSPEQEEPSAPVPILQPYRTIHAYHVLLRTAMHL